MAHSYYEKENECWGDEEGENNKVQGIIGIRGTSQKEESICIEIPHQVRNERNQ